MAKKDSYVDRDRLITSFVENLQKKTTKQSYNAHVRRFFAWCEERRIDLWDVATLDLRRYFAELEEKLQPSTVYQHQSALSSFFRYAEAEGVINASPMVGIARPAKTREPDKSGLEKADLAAVVTAAVDLAPDEEATVLLIAFLGLRPSEIADLAVEDLTSGESPILTIRTRTPRISLPLPPPLANRLATSGGNRPSGPLLHAQGGQPMNRFAVNRIVAKCGRRAGLRVTLTPQLLRKLMIEVALHAGCSAAAVADAVGIFDLRGLTKLFPAEPGESSHPVVRVAKAISAPEPVNDLIHQIDALLHEGGIHPLAPIVLAGALLESKLRSLVQSAGVTISGQGSLSKYIEALRGASVISRVEWRELQLWAELRNQAAHGVDLDTLTDEHAQKMSAGVANFLQAHP